MIKKRTSGPYRAVASRLKKLLSKGMIIEGSLCRADRGNTPRHQLTDRVDGKSRSLYVPEAFAPTVAEWTRNWAEVKALLKEMGDEARTVLIAAITEKTGRKTVKPAEKGKGRAGNRRKPRTASKRSAN